MLRTRRKQAAAKERLGNFIAKITLESEPRNTSSFQQTSTKYSTKTEDKNEIQLLCDKEKLNTNGGLYWTYQQYTTTNNIVEYVTLSGLVEIQYTGIQSNTWPFSPNFLQQRQKTITAFLDFREFSVYPFDFGGVDSVTQQQTFSDRTRRVLT